MKKILLLLVLPAAALALVFCGEEDQPAWTTSSSEALTDFERGIEAMTRMNHVEASGHLHRAVEEDPEFAAALSFLIRYEYVTKEEKTIFMERLRQVNLEALQPRERMLVRHSIAEAGSQSEEAREIVEGYLRKHPRDPYALQTHCSYLTTTEGLEECFRRIVAINPNWVLAQNRLGYLAMARGNFQEAEERFRTYQYVAPGQANPHDSMGELLLLLGRHDEAERELEKALALRPDFSASYRNLIRLFLERGDPDSAERVFERSIEANALQESKRPWFNCVKEIYQAAFRLHWEAVWQVTERCRDVPQFNSVLERYRAALWTGREKDARRIEKDFHEAHHQHDHRHTKGGYAFFSRPAFYHLEGIRLEVAGQPQQAIKAFEKADAHLSFGSIRSGTFKLFNRIALADALELAGRREEAGEILEEVRQINPHLLRRSALYTKPEVPAHETPSP